MKILIITQARFNSTRLPGKVLKKIGDETLLAIHLKRLKRSKIADQVMVATTFEPEAQQIIDIALSLGCLTFQGSLTNVLDRFYQAARPLVPEIVVRVTSDCPLNDGYLIDEMLKDFLDKGVDYMSNSNPPTFADGFDVEIIQFSALEKAWNEAKGPKDLEHVTPYIYSNPQFFSQSNFRDREDNSQYRLTVDNKEDFDLISRLVGILGSDLEWRDYTNFLKQHPEYQKINNHLTRNQGF